MMNDLLWSIEKKEITTVIILDLLAAFDTVNHYLLLTILQNRYGVTDTALQWHESYLRPRGMRVCVSGAYSSIRALNTLSQREVQVGQTFLQLIVPQKNL